MEEKGIWRTVGGRRIFIKEGQDLDEAMKESGKFPQNYKNKKELSKEERAEQSVLLREERQKLRDKIEKGNLSEEEFEQIKKQISEITEKKKELDKDLTQWDLRDAKERIKERKIKVIDTSEDDKIFKNLVKENSDDLKSKLYKEIEGLESYEDDYGIEANLIDERSRNAIKNIDEMYENNKIDDYVYEQYYDYVQESISKIMDEKGYEPYEHKGKVYYSMMPKAKKAYDKILDKLDNMGLNYKITRSWNPGELPSIYVENESGDTFRIANHFNSKNEEFPGGWEKNKIYSTKDYINFEETVIKDLKKWLY